MYFSIIIFPDLPSFEIGTLPFPLSKTLVALYLCRKRSGFHGNVIWNTIELCRANTCTTTYRAPCGSQQFIRQKGSHNTRPPCRMFARVTPPSHVWEKMRLGPHYGRGALTRREMLIYSRPREYLDSPICRDVILRARDPRPIGCQNNPISRKMRR